MRTTILLILINFSALIVFCQNTETDRRWKNIVPLKTSCAEIRRIFEVKECDSPVSIYELKDYSVVLVLSSGKDEWKVKSGTVIQVLVNFKDYIRLDEFEENIGTYRIVLVSDLPSEFDYINKNKGISLSLVEIKGEKWIRSLALSPPSKTAIR